MDKVNARSLAAALAVGSLVVLGCSNSSPQREGPKTQAVSGTITQAGEPIADATVRFEIVGGSKASTGRTNAKGKFVLSTFSAGDGASVGNYRVTVVKNVGVGASLPVSEDDPNYTGTEKEAKMSNVLPQKYASVETSGLTATVTEGRNTFNFPLD